MIDADQSLRRVAEGVARRTSRRNILTRTLQGSFALVGAIAAGHVGSVVSLAWHDGCADCSFQNCGTCFAHGGACNEKGTGCPDGYINCVFGSGCNTCCPYSSGYWTVDCGSGCFRFCDDCRENDSEGSCFTVCGCRSIMHCPFQGGEAP